MTGYPGTIKVLGYPKGSSIQLWGSRLPFRDPWKGGPMERRCAWCDAMIPGGRDRDGNGLVSYGICLTCADRIFADQVLPLQTIIDQLAFPVLVVDSDVTLSILNKHAQEILGVSAEQAEGHRGGELFDCVYAHGPGGCGRSIHCASCALRQAVKTTYATGAPQQCVPATLKKSDPDQPGAIALTITTALRNNVVMVNIDQLES